MKKISKDEMNQFKEEIEKQLKEKDAIPKPKKFDMPFFLKIRLHLVKGE